MSAGNAGPQWASLYAVVIFSGLTGAQGLKEVQTGSKVKLMKECSCVERPVKAAYIAAAAAVHLRHRENKNTVADMNCRGLTFDS